MWKKPNADILNQVKQVLTSLPLITLKCYWVKAHQKLYPNTVMETINVDMNLQENKSYQISLALNHVDYIPYLPILQYCSK